MSDYFVYILDGAEAGTVDFLDATAEDAEAFEIRDRIDREGIAEMPYEEFEYTVEKEKQRLSNSITDFDLDEAVKEVVETRPITIEPYLPERTSRMLEDYIAETERPSDLEHDEYLNRMSKLVVEDLEKQSGDILDAIDYDRLRRSLLAVWSDDKDKLGEYTADLMRKSMPIAAPRPNFEEADSS